MTGPLEYPDAPGFRVSGPSEKAAIAIGGVAKTLRSQVLRTIAAAPQGLTADEVADNRSVLSVRPRVSELHRQGEIQQTAFRGKNASGMTASVWTLSPPLPTQGSQR
jgi:hypothetical protein